MTRTSTASQRSIFASVATITTLMKLLVGSVALLFAMTASAQPGPVGPITWTNVELVPNGTVTGSFTVVPSGPFAATLTGNTTTTGANATTFDSGFGGPTGFFFLNSADGPNYTGAPGFVLNDYEPATWPFEATVFDLDATPSNGSADIAFSVSDGTARILVAAKITCTNDECTSYTVGDEVDDDATPPPTLVLAVPAITNYQYSLDGGPPVALSPEDNASPITISGLTNGTTYSITLQALDAGGQTVGEVSNPVDVTPAGAAGATAVPVGPLWLLGVMAGLLSLVAVRKLRKV